MQLKINVEYKKLLPRLSEEEYEALKESMRIEGQHLPIIINSNNVILDGYTRYDICKELLIVPKTMVVKDFDSELLEKKFVIVSNLKRRQLTVIQKARLGLLLEPIEMELAKERQEATQFGGSAQLSTTVGKSRNIISKKVGLSHTTYDRAKTILEKGTPELIEKVERGEESIYGATKIIESWEDDGTLQNYIDREEIKEKEHKKVITNYKKYAESNEFVSELEKIVNKLQEITVGLSKFGLNGLDDNFRKRWHPLLDLLGEIKHEE